MTDIDTATAEQSNKIHDQLNEIQSGIISLKRENERLIEATRVALEELAVMQAHLDRLLDENVRLTQKRDELLVNLTGAVATITDYLEYEHDGDPWSEDARQMREMDIDDYKRDGRLQRARDAITSTTKSQEQP